MARTPMTEEEKAARKAEREAAAAQAAAEAESAKHSDTDTPNGSENEIEALKKIIQEQQQKIAALESENTKSKNGGGSIGKDEVVTVLYIAEVSDRSVLTLPGYGSLRPNSYLQVPKMEFGGKFMSELVRKMIDKRHIIVVDGLTQDERVRWNCDYKEGEILSERAFDRMLDFDMDRLCDMFAHLCPEHQRFVARRFITAKERNDNRVNFEKVKALNELSKKNDPDGMLKPVLEAFKQEI